MSLNKRQNLSELFFLLKLLQNRFIAQATERFLSEFRRKKSRSKMSIIWTQLFYCMRSKDDKLMVVSKLYQLR